MCIPFIRLLSQTEHFSEKNSCLRVEGAETAIHYPILKFRFNQTVCMIFSFVNHIHLIGLCV